MFLGIKSKKNIINGLRLVFYFVNRKNKFSQLQTIKNTYKIVINKNRRYKK
jgi:hypothetical protein